ncbi:MAG: ABC transporter ATP-binding protein, partial [Alphaproteobacteria bacterium]|nr:ABC transporter ATP-binding protein [Alphaproteobacteria bacterium]
QQMLAMARALCLDPKLLLLDEPSEGLMPRMVDEVLRTVTAMKAQGVAVLLVEQKVDAALAVADRIAFLENGRLRQQASPAELAADPEPLHRYVGVRR